MVEFFAFFQDSCRVNEYTDHDHGRRGADLAVKPQGRLFDASSDGFTKTDIGVQTCWDADRLDLGRVGIEHHPKYLCTEVAKEVNYESSLPTKPPIETHSQTRGDRGNRAPNERYQLKGDADWVGERGGSRCVEPEFDSAFRNRTGVRQSRQPASPATKAHPVSRKSISILPICGACLCLASFAPCCHYLLKIGHQDVKT